jgi:DNA-binding transcriptional MerR regulator
MRSQQKAIFAALLKAKEGSALKIDAPFLTFGDLLECAGKVSSILGGDAGKLNRHTVQAWLKQGLLSEGARSDRNRLFRGLDVIRLATIFQLSLLGLPAKAAAAFADQVFAHFEEHFARRWGAIPITPGFEVEDCVWGVAEKDGWTVYRGGTLDQFHRVLLGKGASAILNARVLVSFAIATVGEKWQQKAESLRDYLVALREKGKLAK